MADRGSPRIAAHTAVVPLEDAPADLLREVNSRGGGGYDGASGALVARRPLSTTTTTAAAAAASAAPPVVTSASADFQRSLVQQQLQQAQRELAKLREEFRDASTRLSSTTAKLNEQKVEYGALTHRYAASIEKLTNTEADVKKLEDQLVQERTRASRLREDGDALRLELRAANEDIARLQRDMAEMDANRGLDRREVQRLLEDRAQYIPTVEARRMQSELRGAQQTLVDRLTRALDGLLDAGEESETAFFVARSAALSAATDLEARVVRAEAALDRLRLAVGTYQDGLETETNDFLLALIAENKELWQHLTKLQADHDVAVSELALERRRCEGVPADQHRYVQRQLDTMTERLHKAQQVMAAQTALAREHEAEMQGLLRQNGELEERLARLTASLARAEEGGRTKSTALEEADAALKDATAQVRSLQDALLAERESADATVRRLTETQQGMQAELEQRVRSLQGDRDALEAAVDSAREELAELRAAAAARERELLGRVDELAEQRAQAEAAVGRQRQAREAEMADAQRAMERELAAVLARLEESQKASLAATRGREDDRAELQTLRAATKTLEAELARVRAEADGAARQLADAVERCRALQAEREELRSQLGTTGGTTKELEKRAERLSAERAELARQLKEEQARGQQRVEQVQRDWHQSERARASLQDELKLLRTRCAEMEAVRQSQDRSMQDREQLMKENLRLHEQYTVIQQETTVLREELRHTRERIQSSARLEQQLQDLHSRLRELPQLRQAGDEARREALKAREETEVLRRERDAMAARLEHFLAESRTSAQLEEAFDLALRDAGDAVRRMGGQVETVKARGGDRTPPAPLPGPLAPLPGGDQQPPRSSPSAAKGPGPRRGGAHEVGVLTAEAAALDSGSRSTSQRPWKA